MQPINKFHWEFPTVMSSLFTSQFQCWSVRFQLNIDQNKIQSNGGWKLARSDIYTSVLNVFHG